GEHLILTKDGVLLVVNFDFGSRILADEDRVALLDVELDPLPLIVELPLADGHDFGLLRFLLGGVGDDDAAAHGLLGLLAPDDDAIVQRSELQCGRYSCHLETSPFTFVFLNLPRQDAANPLPILT